MSLFSLKAERSAPLKPKRSLKHPISMAKVDWKNIEKQTATLAETLLNGFTKQAVADARDFQARAQNQIAEWLVDVANGDITRKNFESSSRRARSRGNAGSQASRARSGRARYIHEGLYGNCPQRGSFRHSLRPELKCFIASIRLLPLS